MRELYIEGLAPHGDHDSCGDVREGVGEALTGVRVGQAIEPRNSNPGCPRCQTGGRQHGQQRYRELVVDPARSENHGMYGTSMRENREVPRSPVGLIAGRAAQGRPRPYA